MIHASKPASSPRARSLAATSRSAALHVASTRAASIARPLVARSKLLVLAGVDGAGRSSIVGAALRQHGVDYFDPDFAVERLMRANPRLDRDEAIALARQQGRRLLERAIAERLDLSIETTLGTQTVPRLLAEAAAAGIAVHVWYVGLSSPALHVARVRARAARGGVDIPDDVLHRRYQHSRLNLIELLPDLAALRLFDNSTDADPAAGLVPRPRLLLDMAQRRIVGPADLSDTPSWARPVVAAALKLAR